LIAGKNTIAETILLLFSKAKKVGKNAFSLIAAFRQPSVQDRSSERRGQDPERQALSGIGNLNGRLLVLSDDEGLSELSESSVDRGLRNQGRTAAIDCHAGKNLSAEQSAPTLNTLIIDVELDFRKLGGTASLPGLKSSKIQHQAFNIFNESSLSG
jgi:hypothetical protein